MDLFTLLVWSACSYDQVMWSSHVINLVMWSSHVINWVMWSSHVINWVMWSSRVIDWVMWSIGSCDWLGHVINWVMWWSHAIELCAVMIMSCDGLMVNWQLQLNCLSLGCWVYLFILHLNSVKVAKAFICFSKKPKRILYLGVWTISGFCVPFQEGGHCQMGFKFHTRKAYWSLITMGFQIRVVSGWESWAAILSLLIGAMSGWGLGGWRGWSLAMWCNIKCIL